MAKSLFMGIDIGTTGVRAAVFDMEGNQLGLAYKEYPMICTEEGMSELDPEVIFQALIEVVRNCKQETDKLDGKIEAIGFSTQMHSFLAVDNEGRHLTNVITWADTRSVRQADMIRDNFNCAELYNKTGCRVQHPMYPLSNILWLRETRPEIFNKTAKFVTIKEYILFRLFGEYLIDITDASATACLNIHNFEWDEDILKEVLKVGRDKFGQPVDCTYVMKGMKKEYASAMGIDPGTLLVAGSGDGIMANVGCGVFDDTSMSCTIGTSGALRIAVDKPLLDPLQRTWCYCFTRDTWVAGGAINNGGIVLRWLRDEYRQQFEHEAQQLGLKSVYKLFDRYAEEIKPGSDGLIFLPFLTGERSPGWNANAKGTIYGLQLIHGKKHLVKATMEGIIYRMFSVYEVISQINSNVKQIKANGGYVNSQIWLQIQADVFNKEIAVAGVGEAAVFGAAYTAMAAVGAVSSLRHPLKVMEPSRTVKPIPGNAEIYQKAYRQFKEIYTKMYQQ